MLPTQAGFSAAEAQLEGFTVIERRTAGFSAAELREGCAVALAELKAAGFGARDLLDAGVPVPQLMAECDYELRVRRPGLEPPPRRQTPARSAAHASG